jgi:hypothetical protein
MGEKIEENKDISPLSNEKLNKIESIVAGCLQDDSKSWEEFWTLFIPTIKKAIKQTLHRTPHPELAQDIDNVENIFKIIVDKFYEKRKLALCKNLSGMEAWLWIIAHNDTRDWLARKYNSGEIDGAANTDNIDDVEYQLAHNYIEALHDNQEIMQALDETYEALGQIDNNKYKWALRLSIIAEDSLSDKEIYVLSKEFVKYKPDEIKNKIKQIRKNLDLKLEKKRKAGERADNLFHERQRLEWEIKSISRSGDAAAADKISTIMKEIKKKDRIRNEHLAETNHICRPSNEEIADLIGLSEQQAQQISTFLVRVRAQLRATLEEKGFYI